MVSNYLKICMCFNMENKKDNFESVNISVGQTQKKSDKAIFKILQDSTFM